MQTEPDFHALAGAFRAESWQRDAACAEHRDVEFFPERGESAEPAKAICAGCMVREECLEYALAEKVLYGVWGMTSARQRVKLGIRLIELAPVQCDGCGEPVTRKTRARSDFATYCRTCRRARYRRRSA